MVSTRSLLGMCDIVLLDCHSVTEFYIPITNSHYKKKNVFYIY